MKFIKYILYILPAFFSANAFSQIEKENDSIIRKRAADVETFYRKEFSILDSLRIVNDTVYLPPVLVEQKIILQDSILVKTTNSTLQKVTLSTFEVSRRNKNRDISYFLVSENIPLIYNNKPIANYQIPFDEISSEKTKQSFWTKKNAIGIDVNQGTFSNWNAGGFNSVSGIAKGDFYRKYEKGRLVWVSELKLRYGLNSQEGQEVRKTDDVLSVNSTFGYKTSVKSNWYYTGKFTLNTQMADGFSYPNIEKPISRAFAPAYIFTGIGAEFSIPDNGLKVYISPATWKATVVADSRLANLGEFGLNGGTFDEDGNLLKAGKRARHELGFLITNQYRKQLIKNVVLDHKINIYTDYLNNFGNIDIDWQIQLEMSVNNYIKATVGAYLIYDDDIKNKRDVGGVQITEGPRVQFKQLLGVGLMFAF